MNEIFFIVENDPEGGYTAKSLYGDFSIFTEADTIPDLKKNIMAALNCQFEDENDIPKIIRLHYVKDEILNYAPAS